MGNYTLMIIAQTKTKPPYGNRKAGLGGILSGENQRPSQLLSGSYKRTQAKVALIAARHRLRAGFFSFLSNPDRLSAQIHLSRGPFRGVALICIWLHSRGSQQWHFPELFSD